MCVTVAMIPFLSVVADAGDLVVYPPDRTAVRRSVLDIVVSVGDRTIRGIEVRNESTGSTTYRSAAEIDPDEYESPHVSAVLSFGENKLVVDVEYVDGVKERVEIGVFRLALWGDLAVAPSGYSELTFHDDGRFSGCERCHQLRSATADTLPQPPSRSTCYPCHRRLAENEHVHGPTATFQCLTCHVQDDAGYEIAAAGDSLCFLCHVEEAPNFRRQYVHGPINTGDCLLCHDVHSSGHAFMLLDSINAVCDVCHLGEQYDNHPVVGHPVASRPDPSRVNRDLSCTSCHDPHSSDVSPYLFYRSTGVHSLCRECHRK